MKIMRLAALGAVWFILIGRLGCSQSTQGIITGKVYDIRSGRGIENAAVNCRRIETEEPHSAISDANGNFVLTLLSPGAYHCEARSKGASSDSDYQPRESYGLALPVAGRLDLDFPLRPASDVYEQGLLADGFSGDPGVIVYVFAADVRTTRAAPLKVSQAQTSALEATVSQVFDPSQIQDLPLAGRDVYTLLLTQPGVASDAGTARSLGLSADGQRPSASNFLLDGLENNNSLVTGPLTVLNPEAIQEYRVSTSVYSAEYGRTAGYYANAITRAGTNAWRGIGYFHVKNDVLNANDFQRNATLLPRTPLKEINPGFALGGPILKSKLFVSGSWDYSRFRSFSDPVTVSLPTSAFHPNEGSIAQKLLQLYPPPRIVSTEPSADVSLAPTSSLNHDLGLARLDYTSGSGKHKLMARVASDREGRPDFIWTPYPQFVMPLSENSLSTAATWTFASASGISQELRAGWNSGETRFDRPNPEVPTLASSDGTILPGSPAQYSFLNRARDFELVENVALFKGVHLPKFGGGVLLHHVGGYLTLARDRIYQFDNLDAFGADQPDMVQFAMPRADSATVSTSNIPVPDYNRTYKQSEIYLFAQDSYRVNSRFVVNYGVRYENFGVPHNTSATQDARLILGDASDFVGRLLGAHIDYPQGRNLPLYDSDNWDWAGRAGFSWSPWSNARTVLRGGYGIFYDRPFDNEWENLRNNSVALAYAYYPSQQVVDYLPSAAGIAPGIPAPPQVVTSFSRLLFYQPRIRSPYTENYFVTLQEQLTEAMTLSVGGFGALGRRLITTDVLNRRYFPDAPGPLDFYRADLPAIYYRANQGASSSHGLTVAAHWKASRGQFHIAWTWSHSIDNQSEPLAGDYYNLDYAGIIPAQSVQAAAFSRQFDSSADRGNSDFDQRQNLVFFSIFDLPPLFASSKPAALFRNWKVSQLAAVRSGLPFTVLADAPNDFLIDNNRANIVDPQNVSTDETRNGGRLLLNAAAFAPPDFHQLGGSGRNAFRAPGFYNVDLSLSRSIAVRALGEAGRAVLRADVFNVLNHANLGTPDPVLSSPTFGLATYGRQGVASGFPAAIPFQEAARQIQLMLRVEF
jgi:hypothetical protein